MSTLQSTYRKLASRLHPDRASDPELVAARTELMQLVNRLRDDGNLPALQKILEGLTRPSPPPEPRRLRASDVDPLTLRRAVLTQDGWVCPAR